MIKFYTFLVAAFVLFSCEKKQTLALTDENLKDVLTQYGKENPETDVIIETSFGTMRLKLYEDTPLHRANFIKLIKDGHYTEAEFYRVVKEFVIQGGNPDKKLEYTLPAEFSANHIHKKGALAMAREDQNNPQMRSSAAEFYIVQGTRYPAEDLDFELNERGLSFSPEQKQIYTEQGGDLDLDQKYTVFGEVTEGFDVIDKIANEKVYNVDKPLKEIPLKITIK